MEPSKFSVVEDVKYVGKTVVRDIATGKLYDAEIKFVGTAVSTIDTPNGREASVGIIKQEDETMWEMVIFDGE